MWQAKAGLRPTPRIDGFGNPLTLSLFSEGRGKG
jgi:hypothetical protein